jgi:hypothetical protein
MESWRARIPAECHDCAAFSRCHGGCRAQAEILDLPADPLMSAPIEVSSGPRQVQMHKQWRPIRRCVVRQETFGYLLLRSNCVVPVSAAALPILDLCDGTRTLETLNHQLGQPGLRLIYKLYQQGVVDMQV